jgi:hypothetical protein
MRSMWLMKSFPHDDRQRSAAAICTRSKLPANNAHARLAMRFPLPRVIRERTNPRGASAP